MTTKDKLIKDVSLKTEKERLDADALFLGIKFLGPIRELLEMNEISYSELAKKVGVSKSYMTQIFKGDKLPNLKLLAKIERALGIRFYISSNKVSPISKSKEPDLFPTFPMQVHDPQKLLNTVDQQEE